MIGVISRSLRDGSTVYWYADREVWIADADLASWYEYPHATLLVMRKWPTDIDVAVEAHTRYVPVSHFDA